MDHAQLSTMDPKLREAYERIMGTNHQPIAQTPTTQPVPASLVPPQTNTVNQPPITQAATPMQSILENQPSNNPPPNDTAPPTQPTNQNTSGQNTLSQPAPFMDPVLADNQMHAYVAQEVAGVKQSLKIIQLMYIVGGLVFFVVYALFWLKFFNIQLP